MLRAINDRKLLAIPDINLGTPLFWIRNLEIITMFYGGIKDVIRNDDGEPELLCEMYTTKKGAIHRKTSDPNGQIDFVPCAFGTCLFLDIDEANDEALYAANSAVAEG